MQSNIYISVLFALFFRQTNIKLFFEARTIKQQTIDKNGFKPKL